MDNPYAELDRLLMVMGDTAKDIAKSGNKLAKSERDWRRLKANTMLKLRSEGSAVTMVESIANGDPLVSDAKFKRDCDEANYLAAREESNNVRKQVDILNAMIEREYRG